MQGINLEIRDLQFHVNSVGTLYLRDPICSVMAESIPSSTDSTSHAPYFVGSSNELTYASTLIYCVDCDAHHVVGPNNHVWDQDDDSGEQESRLRGTPLPWLVGAVIKPNTNK
jgi:hypothetical protein